MLLPFTILANLRILNICQDLAFPTLCDYRNSPSGNNNCVYFSKNFFEYAYYRSPEEIQRYNETKLLSMILQTSKMAPIFEQIPWQERSRYRKTSASFTIGIQSQEHFPDLRNRTLEITPGFQHTIKVSNAV